MPVGTFFVASVALFMLAAAALDYRTRKIPNWLTVPTAILGLAYHLLAPHGAGLLLPLAGFGVGFGLLLLPFLLGGGGMGDVKMLAALGTWLGPVSILVAFAGGAMLAGLMALGVVAFTALTEGALQAQRRYVGAGGETSAQPDEPRKLRRVLPFALPMSISTFAVLAWMLLKSQELGLGN
jgi:prepilin peptidase CpaA